ncbi:PilZ domain-containing protein [Vibrio sp. MA40-2]|uniref:PilZ domain-containing protein n=1 Tax=Vibrio sp. MA40-2 TaxID=3391828 RepID=UPI0039A4C7D7
MDERRRFSRVIYNVPAKLQQDQCSINGSIIDLSLHGLLLNTLTGSINSSQPVDITFHLPDSDVDISLQAQVVETTNSFTRVSIEHIDIDSISHLKRLVALNVGDDQLLNREIEQLSDLGVHS